MNQMIFVCFSLDYLALPIVSGGNRQMSDFDRC